MTLSDATVRQVIREYVSLLRAAGIPVTEVRLFGSRAKSAPRHQYSDIDLCIISSQFGKDYLDEMGLLLGLTAKLDSPVPIEPIPFAPGDLDDRYSTLAGEIREQGVRVEI